MDRAAFVELHDHVHDGEGIDGASSVILISPLIKTAFSGAMAPENSIQAGNPSKVILDLLKVLLKLGVRPFRSISYGQSRAAQPSANGRAHCARNATNPDLADSSAE